ncbi:unnamed protein product [Notodromas monacha]|uniref:Bestrophin homolog n=1 Tax=Notodromas monacha TaxID=399045 RepID=A0A7R9GG76_9CRUS|nr:unnamed protein product [Notodromas monacha]CAG0921408.1 unnamed protein product [Notodromas monacha]
MTISYTSDVATSSGFGCFWKVLWRWKGSIYKLVWKDLFAFLLSYFGISAAYRFALDEPSKKYFEQVVIYVSKSYTKLIPLSFVLGFYVSIIMTRWWNQVSGVPWPDTVSLYVNSCMTNNKSPRARMFRRTIVRYLNLAFVISMSKVSPRVKRRFPTLDHIIEAGLLNDHEKSLLGGIDKKSQYSNWFVPIVWCAGVAKQAQREGMFIGEQSYLALLSRITDFRGACGNILNYDWISVPLVYTQVVTFAVYAYFLADLFGNQWIEAGDIDMYFPIFPCLQFLFYMGWLKVAEVLINPFGDDDEDFELNWVIDRNIQIAYLVADDLHESHPEVSKDVHWIEGVPQDIPHTIASEMQKEEPFIEGSTAHITAESMQEDADIAPPRAKTPLLDDLSQASVSHSPALLKEDEYPAIFGLEMRQQVAKIKPYERDPANKHSVTS